MELEPFFPSNLAVVSADSVSVWEECDQLPLIGHGIQDSYSLKKTGRFYAHTLQWPLRCMAPGECTHRRSSEWKERKKMWSPRDTNVIWTGLVMALFPCVDVCVANNI